MGTEADDTDHQAFTTMGEVIGEKPYQVDMGNGFRPYRLDFDWQVLGGYSYSSTYSKPILYHRP